MESVDRTIKQKAPASDVEVGGPTALRTTYHRSNVGRPDTRRGVHQSSAASASLLQQQSAVVPARTALISFAIAAPRHPPSIQLSRRRVPVSPTVQIDSVARRLKRAPPNHTDGSKPPEAAGRLILTLSCSMTAPYDSTTSADHR